MRNKRSLLVNLSGVALAFAIAFGGIFALWSRLDRERAQLLSGGGTVGIPAGTEGVMSKSVGVVDVEIKAADLSQEELRRAVLCLESASEKYPHEPVPGQLSMTEATRSGLAWLGDFLLPRLDREGMIPKEYRLSCYLWADSQAEADEGTDPLAGYWEVSFAGEELDAVLFLNAVTGQVLRAWIALPYPEGEHPDAERLTELLEDYADSLGVEAGYAISMAEAGMSDSVYATEKQGTEGGGTESFGAGDGETDSPGQGGGEGWGFRQRLEDQRMAVCLEAGDAVDAGMPLAESGKALCLALYLETKPPED
nr:hypothetical protein [uncultured Acetatifactor sp.]